MKSTILAITILAASSTAALAQEPDGGTTPPATTTPAASGDVFSKGTLGFSFPITLLSNVAGAVISRGEPVPTIDVLYFLDAKAAVDLIGGINLHHEQVVAGTPPMSSSTTVFGFAVGAGYRMYKHKDKLHSYIEPQLILAWADTSNSAAFVVHAGVQIGAERMITDWMSFSGAIGGGLNAANKFNDIQVATEADLAATFYFK